MPAAVFAVAVVGMVAVPVAAYGQERVVVERLFRSVLTSVKPVFAPGQEGQADAVIGFDTESTVFEINEPIEKGIIPKPRQSDAEPIGRMFGKLRCIGNDRADKSKPMQVFAGEARYVGRSMKFDAKGTSIVHWCQDASGAYNGIRWTDFSGTMSNIEGRRPTARGHVVGTRLLIGDPKLEAQSGLIIVRFMD
jgi:hypothetical protein